MVIDRDQVDTIRAALERSANEIDGVDLLIEMVPALAKVIMPKTNDEEWKENTANGDDSSAIFGSGSSTEATSRFKSAFRLFLRAIASRDKLLVLVLEDFHWADEEALDLLMSILTDTLNQETLFVATYRNDSNTQIVTIMLKQLQMSEIEATYIFLKNLDEATTSIMIVDILQIR